MASSVSAGGGLMNAGGRALRHDVVAGLLCTVLVIAYSLSYAALIFSGPLAPWLGHGVAMTFLSSAVAAAVYACRSSIPFAIAGPDSSAAAVSAALVAALGARVAAEGSQDLLTPTMLLMAMATGVTGLLLWALGAARAGRAIRYVPYPVIGGFLGATGVLTLLGAIQVVTGHRLSQHLLDAAYLPHLAVPIAVAALLHLILRRSRSAIVLPALLVAMTLAMHVALPLTGTTLAGAQGAGWLFMPQPEVSFALVWRLDALERFPWHALPWLAGDVAGVMFVATVSLLINASGIEMATRREADIDRELKSTGIANLAATVVGGYTSWVSVSRTMLAHAAGGTGRLTGLTVAATSAAMLLVDPAVLGLMPRFVPGALLFLLGAGMVHRWLVASAWQLRPIEYVSLLAIAVIIMQWGFVAGIVSGVVIGCATFAVSASRVNAIKYSFDGSEYRSSLDRSAAELAILAEHGGELQGAALQSYLFFGSANRLYRHVKTLLEQKPECRFLLFDFRLVTGIDSSATHSFVQIRQAAEDAGARLVLVNLTPELHKAFRTALFDGQDVIVAANLDRALESCEDAIIEAHRARDADALTLGTWLADALGSTAYAEHLIAGCRRCEVASGEVIARQGDRSDAMHFILEGRVGVIVDIGEGRSVRVRSLGQHTTIGEMGLITGRPRSATIQAETAGVLYALSSEAYDHLRREHPAVGQALLSYAIQVMAERLGHASRAIGVLQR